MFSFLFLFLYFSYVLISQCGKKCNTWQNKNSLKYNTHLVGVFFSRGFNMYQDKKKSLAPAAQKLDSAIQRITE